MIPTTITANHAMYVSRTDSLGLEFPKHMKNSLWSPSKSAGLDVVLMGAQDDWVINPACWHDLGRLVAMLRWMLLEKPSSPPQVVGALEFYERL